MKGNKPAAGGGGGGPGPSLPTAPFLEAAQAGRSRLPLPQLIGRAWLCWEELNSQQIARSGGGAAGVAAPVLLRVPPPPPISWGFQLVWLGARSAAIGTPQALPPGQTAFTRPCLLFTRPPSATEWKGLKFLLVKINPGRHPYLAACLAVLLLPQN